jgi:hypothetical protein
MLVGVRVLVVLIYGLSLEIVRCHVPLTQALTLTTLNLTRRTPNPLTIPLIALTLTLILILTLTRHSDLFDLKIVLLSETLQVPLCDIPFVILHLQLEPLIFLPPEVRFWIRIRGLE